MLQCSKKNGYARERMLLLSTGGLNTVLALPQIHCSDWLRRRTLSIVAYLVLPQNKPAQFPVLCDSKKTNTRWPSNNHNMLPLSPKQQYFSFYAISTTLHWKKKKKYDNISTSYNKIVKVQLNKTTLQNVLDNPQNVTTYHHHHHHLFV